jgi:tetratricopeptide (TPR) repeat protein
MSFRTFQLCLILAMSVVPPAVAQQPDQPSMPDCAPDKMLSNYQSDIEASPKSSLAYYCMAELLLKQRHYQASVNAYRDALRGDGIPYWTKVWSHVQMGKIFDLTGQRDRAAAQYQTAVQIGDNSGNAITRARELLDTPFTWPAAQ